jgi:hypothetical protein
MRDAVIVEAVRTPVGKGKPSGALAGVHVVDLFAHSIRAVVERSGVDPDVIDDVIGGCVDQVAEQAMNTTRYAALAAGLPEHVPATTVDRQCGSSQQAVHFAAQGVISGAYDVVVAGGVESMSRVPMWSNVPEGADPFGPTLAARYPEGLVPQGISAELIAARWASAAPTSTASPSTATSGRRRPRRPVCSTARSPPSRRRVPTGPSSRSRPTRESAPARRSSRSPASAPRSRTPGSRPASPRSAGTSPPPTAARSATAVLRC